MSANDCGIGEVAELELDGLNLAMGYVIGDFARRKEQQDYAQDMAKWAWDKLGIVFHEKQQEVAISLVENRATAVAAGHGTGKSFQAALAACWWVDTHPINQTYVATTAPTFDQITDIIFREVKNLHAICQARVERKILKPDQMLQGRIGEDNTWKIERGGKLYTVMKGRKPPDSKVSDAFQGIHARYVLAIGDEATGLSEDLIDSLDNITTGIFCRKLLISNPTNPFSHLGKIFLKPTFDPVTGLESWHKIHVSVFDLPTFHGGGRCHESCKQRELHDTMPFGLGMPRDALQSMSGPAFAANKRAEYGEDSARYKARVLGEFAFEDGSTLFSEGDIANAVDAVVEIDLAGRPILGVDLARFGDDWSYVYRADPGVSMRRSWADSIDDGRELPREVRLDDDGLEMQGFKLRFVEKWRDAPGTTREMPDGTLVKGSAERVHELALATGAKEVRVDATGLGAPIIDRIWALRSEAGADYEIVEMQGGAASPDRRAHLNFRAYQMDHMRAMCMKHLCDIDPLDEDLLDQMSGILYDFADGASGGGLKIESKESMRRRGVKSPDAVDAAWYAMADLKALEDPEPGSYLHTDLDEVLADGDWRSSGWFAETW